jgi:hypothetical protein
MGGVIRLLALVLLAVTLISVTSAFAATPAVYKNCSALNAKYPHGLGKATAKDKTTGTPVTTFKRSTKLYNLAMSYNKRLDGDKDGIACENK